MTEFIVGEVSKNWDRTIPDVTPRHPVICNQFEEMIEVNRKRGYILHSFSLHRLMTGETSMNETIIAVFRFAPWFQDDGGGD